VNNSERLAREVDGDPINTVGKLCSDVLLRANLLMLEPMYPSSHDCAKLLPAKPASCSVDL
jgi:hypothetical protein